MLKRLSLRCAFDWRTLLRSSSIQIRHIPAMEGMAEEVEKCLAVS